MTVEPSTESEDACWLHIDDNGIGMTERVLSGPLVDFGKSIWNSTILREEFPGLQSKQITPIGKFGIGFFSVFELADQVTVISRKCDAAVADAKALEFKSISSRPLIRPANEQELPQDFSTRVSLHVKSKARITGQYGQTSSYNPSENVAYSFARAVRKLVAMVDVNIDYNDLITGEHFTHGYDVMERDGGSLIDDLLPSLSDHRRSIIRSVHKDLLRPIIVDGKPVGRVSLFILDDTDKHRSPEDTGSISVGGFLYGRGQALPVTYVGVVEGDTDQAARRHASVQLPPEAVALWATEQAELVDQSRLVRSQLMNMAEKIITLGGDPGSLPYCYADRTVVTYDKFKEMVSGLNSIMLPMSLEYSTNFTLLGYASLGANYFELPLIDGVFVPRKGEDRLIGDELARLITKEGREDISLSDVEKASPTLNLMVETISKVWGVAPTVRVFWCQLFSAEVYAPPPTRWVLGFSRPKVAGAAPALAH